MKRLLESSSNQDPVEDYARALLATVQPLAQSEAHKRWMRATFERRMALTRRARPRWLGVAILGPSFAFAALGWAWSDWLPRQRDRLAAAATLTTTPSTSLSATATTSPFDSRPPLSEPGALGHAPNRPVGQGTFATERPQAQSPTGLPASREKLTAAAPRPSRATRQASGASVGQFRAPPPVKNQQMTPKAKSHKQPAATKLAAEELQVVAAMRRLRQQRDAPGAIRLAEQYLAKHPDGILAEEASAIIIEANAGTTRGADLARRYIKEHPNGAFRDIANRNLPR